MGYFFCNLLCEIGVLVVLFAGCPVLVPHRAHAAQWASPHNCTCAATSPEPPWQCCPSVGLKLLCHLPVVVVWQVLIGMMASKRKVSPLPLRVSLLVDGGESGDTCMHKT